MKMPKFMLRGFNRPSKAVMASLGKLELEVMENVWRKTEVSVRELHFTFGERTAYTTLMTTLDRLYKKKILNRRKEGRAFLYAARFSREELELGIAEDVIDSLFNADAVKIEPVLACIVDAVSDRDRLLLDELERLVQEKRRELLNED